MSAPSLKEIEWAIEELENGESSEKRYELLAALYTCRNEMLGVPTRQPQAAAYSDAGIPASEAIGQYGDSEFLSAVNGKDPVKVFPVIDELMDALQVVNHRAYENVLQKLRKL